MSVFDRFAHTHFHLRIRRRRDDIGQMHKDSYPPIQCEIASEVRHNVGFSLDLTTLSRLASFACTCTTFRGLVIWEWPNRGVAHCCVRMS